MNVSKEEARESLDDILQIIGKTRKSVASGCAAPLLILWGGIWAMGYSASYFWETSAGIAWLVLVVFGSVASWILGWRFQSTVKSPNDARIGFFWMILFGFAFLWAFLLVFSSGAPDLPESELREWSLLKERQFGAYFATVAMFAYVAGGLWLGRFFIFLGLLVTALTLIGFTLFPAYFNLWMAFTGGGALIVSGVYILKCWR